MRRGTGVAFLAALAFATTVAGRAEAGRITVSAKPRSSFADRPVQIRVAGLAPRALATIRLRARDARGRLWHSSATFRANRHGVVDANRASAVAGAYRGVWGMGLVASLTTSTRASGTSFSWSPAQPQTFTVAIRLRGKSVATASFRRGLTVAVPEETETLAEEGFDGRYFSPPPGSKPTTGVLFFGGSEGGLSPIALSIAAALAQRGFPTLAIAYFRAPGLPQTLESIPLEYFARALAWLRDRPGVASHPLAVIGVSRGSEAAQLLGVHFPELVGAVVASVPSNVVLCGFPACTTSSWTFEGRPVPWTSEFNNPYPADHPDAAIPDEKIRGPLFLICGGLDSIWISCLYADAIMTRLRASQHPYADVLRAYAQAGHGVGALLPYQPVAPSHLQNVADERGREYLWPRLIAFLRRS